MTIKVNGVEIGRVITNRSLTIQEAMYAIGYDITDPADCERGYANDVEGFYLDDCLMFCFDTEAAEMVY